MKLFEYFPELEEKQKEQLSALEGLYRDWNEKINVVSRKDIDNINLHHIQHSLSLVKLMRFNDGSKVLDLGTGGGFPGIPLAIYFPEVEFLLIDGTRKKLHVVNEVAEAIGLDNVKTKHVRAENCKAKADFVVTRGVAPLIQLLSWARPLISKKSTHAFPNGMIAYKGGKIEKELNELPPHEYYEIQSLSTYFDEEYFDEKYLIYCQG